MKVTDRIKHIESLLPEERKFFDITVTVVGSRKMSEAFAKMYQDEPVIEVHENSKITTVFVDTGREKLSAGSSGNTNK